MPWHDNRTAHPFYEWPEVDPGEPAAALKQYCKECTEAVQAAGHGTTFELITDAIVPLTGARYDWAICSRDLHNRYRETEYFHLSVAHNLDGTFDVYYSEAGAGESNQFGVTEQQAIQFLDSELCARSDLILKTVKLPGIEKESVPFSESPTLSEVMKRESHSEALPDCPQLSNRDVLILELLGSDIAIYLAEMTADPNAVRSLIEFTLDSADRQLQSSPLSDCSEFPGKLRFALDATQQAQRLIDHAAQHICSIPGLSDQWSELVALHSQIKKQWHSLAEAFQA